MVWWAMANDEGRKYVSYLTNLGSQDSRDILAMILR